ncbi:MAG: SDR family oxidoreductase, partial [Alphaproteobacteria bacterium]
MKGLDGKTAIVTGGAQSLGAGVVAALKEAGVNVVIADIAEEQGAALADRLGETVVFKHTDLRSDDDIRACVSTAVDKFGGIDFLINVACSYLDDGPNSPRADWLTSLDINFVGHVVLMQEALPHMKKRGGGAIVNFSSISARVAQPGRWLYPVSKAAITQLTRNQAMDLAQYNIRVNSVSPGWIWCRLMSEVTNDDKAKTNSVAAPFHM